MPTLLEARKVEEGDSKEARLALVYEFAEPLTALGNYLAEIAKVGEGLGRKFY